jgi:hypothetical protein
MLARPVSVAVSLSRPVQRVQGRLGELLLQQALQLQEREEIFPWQWALATPAWAEISHYRQVILLHHLEDPFH